MDEFYTQRPVAAQCWTTLVPVLRNLGLGDDAFFIEPSAGDGAFYDLLPLGRRVGFDVEPRHCDVDNFDFLRGNYACSNPPDATVIVGNPPFGKRGKMAVNFFVKGSQFADTIALILPIIFRKYFIHKQLPADFRLIHALPLARDSFITPNGKPYSVNTEFQVWTRKDSGHPDYRLFTAPQISHFDFEVWQYNNTKEALKVFDNKFDFAVPCQGWQDYSRRVYAAKDCEKHKQWMLFKARNETVFNRLHDEIDYAVLAIQNTTSTPGFRKGDLVAAYIRRYGALPFPTKI